MVFRVIHTIDKRYPHRSGSPDDRHRAPGPASAALRILALATVQQHLMSADVPADYGRESSHDMPATRRRRGRTALPPGGDLVVFRRAAAASLTTAVAASEFRLIQSWRGARISSADTVRVSRPQRCSSTLSMSWSRVRRRGVRAARSRPRRHE